MPSIGHLAVGMAAGRGLTPSWRDRWRWILALALVSCAADLDLVLLLFGDESNSIWGHRGFTHSLAAGAVVAGVFALVARRWGTGSGRAWILGFLVFGTHLVLDCMNVGTKGVPWLWPLSSTYHALPWRPIPAVISAHDFLSWRGVPVLLAELVIFSPAFVYGLWGTFDRRRSGRSRGSAASPRRGRRQRVESHVE